MALHAPTPDLRIGLTPQEYLDGFFRYVQNDIPHRLIFIPDMKLVGRSTVYDFFLESIQERMADKDFARRISQIGYHQPKAIAINDLVRETAQYAILSHRWLPQGECTFEDMANGTAEGPGFEKLTKFCEAAMSRGYKFAWSDTCCIDKTSSSELGEAIRSMFRWYQNASLCVIHLAQTESTDSMGSDEWFERGWTLQELLAPPVAKFFGADWKPLTEQDNDKSCELILQHLSAATGCQMHEFRHFTPGPFHVDKRMTWAARRKTTRGEDMAYSLMGIFDVTLQPAYGEGAERAFFRLVEMIMQSNGSTSVLNWAGKEAETHNSMAFPSSPHCYIGHVSSHTTRGTLDLATTSRGLQIPLVILPVTLKRAYEVGTLHHRAEFDIENPSLGNKTDTISIDIRGVIYRFDRRYALGVFNYMTPDTNLLMPGYLALRQLSMAYLLSRVKAPSPAKQVEEGSVVRDDLRYYGWTKVPTFTHVYFTLNTIGKFEAMVINKDILETVYL